MKDKHEKQEATMNKISCDLCGAGYTTEAYLKNHMKDKHGQGGASMIQCTECGKILGTKQSLERHTKNTSSVQDMHGRKN